MIRFSLDLLERRVFPFVETDDPEDAQLDFEILRSVGSNFF